MCEPWHRLCSKSSWTIPVIILEDLATFEFAQSPFLDLETIKTRLVNVLVNTHKLAHIIHGIDIHDRPENRQNDSVPIDYRDDYRFDADSPFASLRDKVFPGPIR